MPSSPFAPLSFKALIYNHMRKHNKSTLKKASSVEATTMENLPNEVLSDILLRLLAKQLAQMRCVCKPWNALLRDPSFIKSHLHQSLHNKDEVLLFFSPGCPFDFRSFTARRPSSPDLELPNFIKLPVSPQSTSSWGGIIGSVNGLICFNYRLCNGDYVLHVWNPSLSAVLTLPPSSLPTHYSSEVHFGFGFDPKTDDYTILKLTSSHQEPKMVTQVEVYSLRKGSWKLISERFPSHVKLRSTGDGVCSDGREGQLHWIGLIDGKFALVTIVAFDVGEETFSLIPLPDSVLAYQGCCLNVLGVLFGKLCVMARARYFQSEVWVMEEYGVPESWVQHHALSQFGGEIYPYGFTLNGEFLFHVIEDCFSLYDPITEETKTFEIKGGEVGIIKVVEYVDSLVWVTPTRP